MLVVIRPFRCGVILYSVWWDSCDDVYVCIGCEWKLLCRLVIMVDYKYSACLCIFFGGHPSPMDGF